MHGSPLGEPWKIFWGHLRRRTVGYLVLWKSVEGREDKGDQNSGCDRCAKLELARALPFELQVSFTRLFLLRNSGGHDARSERNSHCLMHNIVSCHLGCSFPTKPRTRGKSQLQSSATRTSLILLRQCIRACCGTMSGGEKK